MSARPDARRATLLLFAAVSLGACADASPRIAGPSASDRPFSDGLPEDGGAVVVASASSAPSAAPPSLPTGIVECSAADGPSFGDDKPSVDDVARALAAAGDKACLPARSAEEALRVCASRVGSAELHIGADDRKGPSGCDVTIHGAREGGRRFVVFSTFYREHDAKFWGAATSVELTPTSASVYVSTLTPEQAPLCPESGATGDVAPKDMPPGWSGLSGSLHAFLCSGK